MNTITVDELYKALTQARKAGLGGKKILLCFFAVSTDVKSFGFGDGWAAGMLPYGVTPEEAERDYVIVG